MMQLALPIERTERPAWTWKIVPPVELRDGMWEVVAEKLNEVRRKTNASWIVEDIYSQIHNRQAFCFVLYRDSDLHGITIVRQDRDQFSGDLFCLSYASWFDDFDAPTAEQVVRFYDDIARNMGVKRIEFCSPRIGWKGKQHGCKLKTVIWERVVNG
jgi:hypothetical protein